MGANCSCRPSVCKTPIDLQPAPHGGIVEMNPAAYEQERRASIIFRSYSLLAVDKCFIFIAFVLLVFKTLNNYVVSNMKGIKEIEIIYS